MALPVEKISQIPNNEPDAVPALWNTRYEEIDQNFEYLESERTLAADELAGARGEKASTGERIGEIEERVEQLSPEFQDHIVAAVKYGLDQSSMANRSIQALKQQIQQEGEIALENRGVVSGCTATRSTTAARNLNLASGVCFANGRAYSVGSGDNMASVPSNITNGSASAVAYLYQTAANSWKLAVTAIGEPVPAGAIRLYNITIPANSTDSTDPSLANVTLTSVRRVEPGFPKYLDSPPTKAVSIEQLSANDYRIDWEVVAADGAPCSLDGIRVSSRAPNGFTVEVATAADNIRLRYRVSKLNN